MAPPRESIDLEERNKKIREVIGDFESENNKKAEIKQIHQLFYILYFNV